jgi:hypothetical protein
MTATTSHGLYRVRAGTLLQVHLIAVLQEQRDEKGVILAVKAT